MAWFRNLLLTLIVCLAILGLSRAGLLLWQHDRLVAAGLDNLPFIFIQGLRFDLVTLGLLLGLPAILTPLFVVHRATARKWTALSRYYCLLVVAAIVFMEMATPSFINEYDSLPDRRFAEYLVYPHEVFAMLWSAYKLQLLLAAVVVGLSVWLHRKLLQSPVPVTRTLRWWSPVVLVPCISLLVLVAVRSTNDHRPVNPSTVVYTSDPLANQFPLNPAYTALYGWYETRGEPHHYAYRKLPFAEATAAAREEARLDDVTFPADPDSTAHIFSPTRSPSRPLNIVIILEESLGADFVGYFGGPPITPELDSLRNQGIWFDNLYATGTRSVRGIEAVVSGFLPTTARSVVKQPRAQTGFFTLASLLRQQGYSTEFLYGGEPQFDNMGRFFANNGFDHIVGRHDFSGPVFDGSWGASDEDLFNLADQRFRAAGQDQPFFSLLFTTSNHSPFDYPPGRIEAFNSPSATVENAVKYADYALGEFIRKARRSPYWDNTVFLVIADHSDRVYGDEPVPVRLFHIPAVILGGSIKPQLIERIASQIDMLPTLLSLAGVGGDIPAIGIDQMRTDLQDFPGRAIMQYGKNQAYMEGDTVVIQQPGKPAATFRYRKEHLVAAPDNPRVRQHAVALANWPWYAYMNQTYCAPGQCVNGVISQVSVARMADDHQNARAIEPASLN